MKQETLFISDLHLSASRPDVVQRFLHFIDERACSAQRLFILGDLFDAHIGDDNNAWPYPAIRASLKRLCAGNTALFIQQGNRDFLLGQRFCNDTGAGLLGDYHVIDLYGTPTLLTHGDLLCTDDVHYQAARLRVRTETWKSHALSKPLWLRQLYARWYRFKSGRDKDRKSLEIMDVNHETVCDVLLEHGVTRILHGHTHRPAVHDFEVKGQPCQRFVLPEWAGQEWVLCWDKTGYWREPIAQS